MSELINGFKQFLDVHFLITTFGYPGLFAVVFAETGLFLGFFLPGDSLLITAGIFASKGLLNIFILIPLLFFAASLGNLFGFIFGQKVGKRLFNQKDSFLFRKEHLHHAHAFYEKHGPKAIILARFVPIIRTFAPIAAGIADMAFTTFMIFNLIGSILWAIGIVLVGFFLGQLIPDKYFEPLIILVIILSLMPAIYEVVNTKEKRNKLFTAIRSFVQKKK
jgi:membrane-associated protein